ncbi:MAG TPA: DUF1501 domain-containing protein [Gemmataceae bacterium]|jgi:hypothetical protein|nr:DUF1501 domain-containing protein [Gemmataceae bacterium]
MFLIRGSAADLRQGWTRRDCLRVGLGGTLGLLGGPFLSGASVQGSRRSGNYGQARSCILVYLFGGPSHIDIWDMKPAAPAEIRGEFQSRATNVAGMRITEHLPRLAGHADKYAIIRSLSHGDNAHGSSGHAMLTGRFPKDRGEVGPGPDDFPHYGSVLTRLRPAPHGVAPFVALPWMLSTSTNIVPGQNGGCLGRAADPLRLETPADQSLTFAPPFFNPPPDVSGERVRARRALQERLETHGLSADNRAAADMRELYQRAYRLMNSGQTARAFRLDREPDRLRQRYGMNVFGQSLLLARRLAEAGVPMITVYWPDRKEAEAFNNNGVRDSVAVPAWDTHGHHVGATPNFPSLRDKLLPALDVASSALLEDLHDRGLLGQTLVAWTGEFGRSPRINGDAGRDHYGNVFSVMLAGGGVRGGQVYGSSDKHGAFPADNPVSPAAFAATLYHCLGIPHDAEIPDRLGRPIRLTDGEPVRALLT